MLGADLPERFSILELFYVKLYSTYVYTHRYSEFLSFGPEIVVVGSVYEMRLSRWKNLFTKFSIMLKTSYLEKSHYVLKMIN